MELALKRLQLELSFDLAISDLDADPTLGARYDERVPVIECGGSELCHYYFDEAAVRAHLSNFR